eukprot:CAMPEP_0204530906 /NCGR_PEP_ID=MMETSP0661-20131031/10881_1 /ASSEMBLY_ACC=CAM_ASM_000606 /TAXON_ID=109239 /ORGANISM="Alexandrium margalefi, Strain AMGDE01CS-322" /LENGTH=72 /DNA_ID=CAMNT_0051537027 /DNA_START=76 /DNA_END=292 /DNA_ORIENTATION=-
MTVPASADASGPCHTALHRGVSQSHHRSHAPAILPLFPLRAEPLGAIERDDIVAVRTTACASLRCALQHVES